MDTIEKQTYLFVKQDGTYREHVTEGKISEEAIEELLGGPFKLEQMGGQGLYVYVNETAQASPTTTNQAFGKFHGPLLIAVKGDRRDIRGLTDKELSNLKSTLKK